MKQTCDGVAMDSTAVRVAEKMLDKDQFIYFLDQEVKRAHRYQNFFCLLIFKFQSLTGDSKEVLKAHNQRIRDLIVEETRESDLIGLLDENRMVIFLPYADPAGGDQAKSRFEDALKYDKLENKDSEVMIQKVCFPVDGTYTAGILEKVALSRIR